MSHLHVCLIYCAAFPVLTLQAYRSRQSQAHKHYSCSDTAKVVESSYFLTLVVLPSKGGKIINMKIITLELCFGLLKILERTVQKNIKTTSFFPHFSFFGARSRCPSYSEEPHLEISWENMLDFKNHNDRSVTRLTTCRSGLERNGRQVGTF